MNTAVALVAVSNEAKKSGPIGLVVIVLLCLVCYFLFRSMSRHMRKVREEFPGTEKSPNPPPRGAQLPKADEQHPAQTRNEPPAGEPGHS